MRFTLATVLALAAYASAAILPQEIARSIVTPHHAALNGYRHSSNIPATTNSTVEHTGLAKREIILVLLTAIVTAAATELGTEAAQLAIEQVKDIINWDDAREAFTKATTAAMWASNPDTSKYPAVICYNEAYDVKNTAGIYGKVSLQLKSGLLNTNYDCMYMTANNAFYTYGDGGYENLSYEYSSACSYDSSTLDLSC